MGVAIERNFVLIILYFLPRWSICCTFSGLSQEITHESGADQFDFMNATCVPKNGGNINKKATCTISNLNVNHMRLVRFTHSDDDVKMHKVIFKNASLPEIPVDIFHKYPNLHTLSMDNCSLNEFKKLTFKHAKKLVHLNLPNNNARRLTDAVFIHSFGLKSINLSFNRIIDMDRHAFKNLTNLEKLFLSHNNIKRLDEYLFNPLTNLTIINLESNNIEIINRHLFQFNGKLKGIFLNKNKIILIEDHSFVHLKHLKFLNLSNNLLRDFNTRNISVHNFSINNNQLRKLHLRKHFVKVFARNNTISRVTCDSSALSAESEYKMTELVLEENSIQSFGNECWEKMKNLEVLNLARNEMANFNLTVNLNSASLHTISLDSDLLDYNDIRNLRTTLPKVNTISVSDNKFNCTFWNRITRELALQNVHLVNYDEVAEADDDLVRPLPTLPDKHPQQLQMQRKTIDSSNAMEQLLNQYFMRIDNKFTLEFERLNEKMRLMERRFDKLFQSLEIPIGVDDKDFHKDVEVLF